ncbi:MAG TPA: ATP-dependent DNA helicase RecG [Xanthomonadales bacterium]|nr:ATP-dependent DNA helicase RecG [Xanthomonadales bacterium]
MAQAEASRSDPGEASLADLAGIGARLAEKLAARGFHRVRDLWLHLPRRYEDRTRLTAVRSLRPGEAAQVEGQVEAVERSFRSRPVLKVALDDGSGATLVLRFFHFRAAQVGQFQHGRRLRVFGTVRAGQFGPEMVHPSYRWLDDQEPPELSRGLTPVYPAIEGIGPTVVARIVGLALDRLPEGADLELLPDALRERLGLPSLGSALRFLHRPPPGVDLDRLALGLDPAQRRLAFEELLAHHLSLRRQRIAVLARGAEPIQASGRLVDALVEALPFRLTGAQRAVFEQIRTDLGKATPMQRLVQGDVGSGKTVVAAMAAALTVEAGYGVALAAPTELLAEQHLGSLQRWFEPLGIEVAWLAGKVTGKARSRTLERIASGEAAIVVGTHALMQDGVEFARLGLAIVDEQHRFGVRQRLALAEKGSGDRRIPHRLVMTATPIPRTLAMTAYADLDVSIIDELPPGRTPVVTVAVNAERRDEVVQRIRAACAEGRQAYWVCPLIEEPDQDIGFEAQAAESTYAQLCQQLPELRIGLIHGRLKGSEKQQIMRAFKAGEIDLLVATTVIEVGVDVPNASLMLIENAERLGLAQLHQLRGRVGRGAASSSCVLLFNAPLSAMARQRIETLRASNDGFVIAEKDLALRGPGELLGTRQTGQAAFRIADLARDADLLPRVHSSAEQLLREHPECADRLAARWIGAAVRFAEA